MTLTAKDHDEIRRQTRLPWFLKLARPLVHVVRPLTRIPWIRRKLAESYGGLMGTFFKYQREGDHENALKTVIVGIEKYKSKGAGRFGFLNHHCWWSFMRYGVEAVAAIDAATTQREQLIAYARNGIKPLKGYDVAYVYYCFARWRYESGDMNEAVAFARVASGADHTWGEPDFLLGWFALVAGESYSAEHLVRAVRKDPRIYFRISNDPICKTRPDILARIKRMPELQELVVTSDDAPSPD